MAAEILGSRWTIVLLRELCAGSTRFNDLRRGVPRMSPALLSKRLKELEEHGVIQRRLLRKTPETFDYVLTEAGRDLAEVIMTIGIWGQRWVESRPSLDNAEPTLLMWDMRRNLKPLLLPERRIVIQFIYSDLPTHRNAYWLLSVPETGADLCTVDPGFDVDLYVNCSLRTMTAIWIGVDTVDAARSDDRLVLVGDRTIRDNMQDWLGLSPFAPEPKRVA